MVDSKAPQFFSLPVNLNVPGCSVLCPKEPILPNGTVNFIFQIRGIAPGDIKTVGKAGINAVIVTAEAGGMGSAENLQRFGNAQFVNDSVNKILSALKAKFPNKNPTVGNIALSSWSGGYGAISAILKQQNKLIAPISAVTVFDGIHEDPYYNKADPSHPLNPKDPNLTAAQKAHIAEQEKNMKVWVDYANAAKKDPSKKFIIVHTDIQPPYGSTTGSANYIKEQVGTGGGFSVYRVPGNDATAHIAARDTFSDIWSKNLSNEWNQGTYKPENNENVTYKDDETNKETPGSNIPGDSNVAKIYKYLDSAIEDLKNLASLK